MTVDLDAIELRAMRFHKLNPLHECFDSTTVLALVAELRQERERAELFKREQVRLAHRCDAAQRALSRAEETIDRAMGFNDVTDRDGWWHVTKMRRILTEYGKQKGRIDD